jgi:HEAT repeat protein
MKTALVAMLFALGQAAAQDDPKKAAQEEAKKLDEEAKARIAAFKKDLRACKTDADRVTCVNGLGSGLGAMKHPRILDELKTFLKWPTPEVVICAAEQIGKYEKNRDAAETLVATAGARREPDVIVKCLRYAGDVGYRPVAPKLTAFFKNRDVGVAREAVDSCAKLKSKDTIDPLLSLWRELDNIKEEKDEGGGLGGLGGGLTGTNPVVDEQRKRKGDLTPAVSGALAKITGQDFKAHKDALEWWRKSRAGFQEPAE